MNGIPAYKEEKGKGKIRNISIDILDDGSFAYSVYTDKGNGKKYSYQGKKDLLSAIDDDVSSPHLRTYKGKSMRLGGGGRFAKMVDALESEGKSEKSAKAIAASVGRKKYGKANMTKWSKQGMKRARV